MRSGKLILFCLLGWSSAVLGAYEFESKSSPGESSVVYEGQVLRQALIEELAFYMGSMKNGEYPGESQEALQSLESYLTFRQQPVFGETIAYGAVFGSSPLHFKCDSQFSQEATFEEIHSGAKDLKSKLAGEDNPLRRGKVMGLESFGSESYEILMAMFEVVAHQAVHEELWEVSNPGQPGGVEYINEAYITTDGLDLRQLSQKFLHGALSFSQAAGDYLSLERGEGKGLLMPNEAGDEAYTPLEHHWDEAFGYFGAPRNYLEVPLAVIRAKSCLDGNGDGKSTLLSEWPLGIFRNLAKVADYPGGDSLSFAQELMDDFYRGRVLIHENIGSDEGDYRKELETLSLRIRTHWERVIAATVIHYINATSHELSAYGGEEYLFRDLVKYWAEMKGYGLAFQFSPVSLLSDDRFDEVHELMGLAPVLPHSASAEEVLVYQKRLSRARSILVDAFGFDQVEASQW